MSLLGKSEEDLRELKAKFLSTLEQLETESKSKGLSPGRKIGNISLLKKLRESASEWDELYWPVRDMLLDEGKIVRGRGQGGAVASASRDEAAADSPETPKDEAMAVESAIRKERGLYAPVAQALSQSWVKDQRFFFRSVEVTAGQGKRFTGGKWTRPDIVVVGLRLFPYLPGKSFDLVTFEVKSPENLDITAVYEALAHRRAATQSYVWVSRPDAWDENFEEVLETVRKEAETHGVGLIAAADPEDVDSWDVLAEPLRVEPDAAQLSDFITTQLSEGTKEGLAQNVR